MKLLDPNNWHGVWTALITPLDKKNGSLTIDINGLENLIEQQIISGVNGFVIGGSTGEGSILNSGNYNQLLKSVSEITNQRVPLVAGLGCGGTENCIALANIAKKHSYDGLLISPPVYIKPSQEHLIYHYQSLATLKTPICIYEVPSRAGTSIELNTIKSLVEKSEFFTSIKDATANMERAKLQKTIFENKLALLSGDDFTIDEFIKNGGHGTISVASHAIANILTKIISLSKNQQTDKSSVLQKQIKKFNSLLFKHSNPIPVKCLINDLELISNDYFCSPLSASGKDDRTELLQEYNQIKDL